MKSFDELSVKVFADGADLDGMVAMAREPYIKGFTTNPTLMHKAGIKDYKAFAKAVLQAIPDRPISFEVFSDEFEDMERQAREIATWGENVYVKVPITNTRAEFSGPLISRLTSAGVKVNVTALMTAAQVQQVSRALRPGVPSCVSVFAGRVADTGRDPIPIMNESLAILAKIDGAELIWASPREFYNIFQAAEIGCHIITVTNDLLKKIRLVGKNLDAFSLETVEMFHRDASAAGFRL
jgi:transaldolase